MGRIDPAPGRPTRPPISPAGWIVAAGLAAVLAVLLAFQAGKRSAPDRVAPVVTVPIPTPAQAEQPAVPVVPTPAAAEWRIQHAVMDVTLPPRPAVPEAVSAPPVEPSPVPAETMRDQMSRCLTFQVEGDEVHSVSRPFGTQVRISVRNSCSFSFAGSDVWYEVRAIPRRGGGVGARKVGQFSGGPIEPKSRAELVDVLECPACYEDSYRYEARLWWGSSDGRTE